MSTGGMMSNNLPSNGVKGGERHAAAINRGVVQQANERMAFFGFSRRHLRARFSCRT